MDTMGIAASLSVHRVFMLAVFASVIGLWRFGLALFFRGNDLSTENVCLQIKNGVTEQSHGDPARSKLENDFGNTGWCRNSVCNNSQLCKPCQRRFLIIFTVGRSASTTLTWMMDSLPGIRMSGENNDLLRKKK
jgi:hypothetical protein